jgi:hypothetical protein
MGENSGSVSGMNSPDHISESLKTTFWVKILKFFDMDPGSASEKERQHANERRGTVVGEELNHTTARKPGLL